MDSTVFVNEIKTQPSALKACGEYYSGDEGRERISRIAREIGSKRRIVFTGMGTSLYAPYVVMKELAKCTRSAESIDAGELLHFGLKGFIGDEIVIAVSQSGESAETREVVKKLKGTVQVVSIVNDPESSMGRDSDIILPIHAGSEASISAKTYTNTLAVLLMLAVSLRNGEHETVIHHLYESADLMERTIEESNIKAEQAAAYFDNLSALHVIARGSDLVTARQLALIIKEGAGVFSEALSGGLFRHGPIELAGKGHAALVIVSEGNEPGLSIQLAEDLRRYGSRILVVTDGKQHVSGDMMTVPVKCPHPGVFPVLCAPFIELFVHAVAKRKGTEAGIFRHAAKITSRE